MNNSEDWFKSWFNTPYYHILYKHRNDDEARLFMQNLTSFLKLKKQASILDLPCGKGRHSVYLNSLGYHVIGADLSENNISIAKQYENENLKFEVHDMRKPFTTKFDAIFNLFTSFGYFENDEDDIAVLKNIKVGLKENGVAVIDFLNVYKVLKEIITQEKQEVDGITFHINRYVKDNFILKEINFEADGKNHQYFEKVKCLDLETIEEYLAKVGLTLHHTFGDYNLGSYKKETSNRLILIVK